MAAITLLTETGDELEVACVFGTTGVAVGARLPVAHSLNGLVVGSGHELRTRDAMRDRRPAVRSLLHLHGARGVLIVPLRAAHGPIGTIAVAKRVPWRFSNDDLRCLFQLADAASVAAQNQQLRDRLARSRVPSEPARPPGSPSAQERSAEGTRVASAEQPRLSRRQLEVLELLVAGKSCGEVADALRLSRRTVEHHVERLKLRCHQSRLHGLVGYAVAQGLQPPVFLDK